MIGARRIQKVFTDLNRSRLAIELFRPYFIFHL